MAQMTRKRRKKYRWNPVRRRQILTGLSCFIVLALLPGIIGNMISWFGSNERSLDLADIFGPNFHPVALTERDDLVRRHRLIGEDERATVPLATWNRSVPPLIYIFNAHDHEVIGAESAATYWIGEMTIMEVSRYMADLFEGRGIPTFVEERLPNELIEKRGWMWESHYRASRVFLEEAIEAHPSLQFFFDIHRDSIYDERIRTTIHDEPYATLIFVMSEDHPDYARNFEVVHLLIEKLEARYPGIMRRDYLTDAMTPIQSWQGMGNTSLFNQDLSENLILFEIGGPTSSVEEVLNTVHALVNVLYDLIVQ